MNCSDPGVDIVALFDGECMMCNNFVKILDRAGQGLCNSMIVTSDSKRFVSLIGDAFDEMYVKSKSPKTIVVYANNSEKELLERSMAIGRLLGATKDRKMILLSRLILFTPRWIADTAYNIISRYRRRVPLRSCSLKKLEWVILDE